jgi:polysaccharide export outer membrane protein
MAFQFRKFRASPVPAALVVLLLAALPTPAGAIGGPRPVTASVEGQVRRPGTYTLPYGATLSALILAAGGYADNADLHGASLARESEKAAQQIELRDLVDRLKTARTQDRGGLNAWQHLLDGIRALRPSGRIPAPLTHPRLLKGSPQDLLLVDGDVLRVPLTRDTVTVCGAVRAPGIVLPYSDGAPATDYVRRAGGSTARADPRDLYLLRSDGTVTRWNRGFIAWNRAASRWEIPFFTGSGPKVAPGDTIFVPRNPAPDSPAASVDGLHAILMRIAEITGTVPELP